MWFLVLSSFLSLCIAVDPVVELSYATYEGTALSNGVSQWLGMRFAKPPLGDLRFAAPEEPAREYDVIPATTFGLSCIGLGQSVSAVYGEDCLFLNVFAPSKATRSSNLPVYVFIGGGGFNTQMSRPFNGSGLLTFSEDMNNIVIVNFNYRVASLGFLASQEVVDGGSVNNGLKDQRLALEWVQKHIEKFGGDPNHVTIGGPSAGGASVTLQLIAYGGRDDGLFHATAAQSQSFGPVLTVDESQYQYDNLVNVTDCSDSHNTLDCLRGLDINTIQSATNQNIPYPNIPEDNPTGPPIFMWNPVIDHDFINALTIREFLDGNFVKVPAIYGDDTNEGTIFCPRGVDTIEASNVFLKNQFYHLKTKQIERIDELYPQAEQFPDSGAYWRQCSNAYGDLRYTCPGVQVSDIYARHDVPVWNYRWNVIDAAANASGIGVAHTIENNAIWTPTADGTNSFDPASYVPPDGVNVLIIPLVQGYWNSFIRTGDPNKFRMREAPVWEPWMGKRQQRLKFETGDTKMEMLTREQREQCGFFESIALDIRQ